MYNSPYFDHGITNGTDWYVIYGGMQDWNYEWQGDFEVTIEQSNTFWPPASQLPSYWADNQESMISDEVRAAIGIEEFGPPELIEKKAIRD